MATVSKPRIRARQDDLVPRALVRAMFALVMTCLALVAWATWTGKPLESTPPEAPVIAERMVFLSGDISGAARVLDENGSVIASLSPEEGGFIAGVERVIARERMKHGLPNDMPVALQLREGNRLSIHDPATGWGAELMGFGITNARAFARLLDQP